MIRAARVAEVPHAALASQALVTLSCLKLPWRPHLAEFAMANPWELWPQLF
eukprot:CAMPEP_0198497596 /NCGR_PEP_ID=MMETSP1462-20131121/6490_1 /TAXON_ID=1333877 /ORGANISM="Brandtodinium nutriculum, Strain RCC3387" /LENGTH=50 /DNA_ID=CAMNT_0044226473 /DNA_START=32 /DNA_END=181 /DNA_ORIENTATION=+